MSGDSCPADLRYDCTKILLAAVSSKELVMVSFTLVVYDHAITFAQEVYGRFHDLPFTH